RRPWTIISSDLRRAHATARALATEVELEVRTDPRLRETHLGAWQGMSHAEADEQWPGARGRWPSSRRWAPPEGESRLDVAHATARALATEVELGVRTDPRLRETHLGAWQGMSHAEVDEQWPGARGRWRSSPRWAPPEGESRLDVAHRTREVVDELVDSAPEWSEHPAVLVAHGGAIAALTATLLELPVEHYAVFNGLGNTCWVQLSAHPRPAPDTGADDRTEVSPTTPGARNVLWRLDQWNAGITPPVEAP